MTGRCGQQKTHSRFQPWVLVKIFSISTRANGLAYYEGYQRYLSNNTAHFAVKIAKSSPAGQALFRSFSGQFRANHCAISHPITAMTAPPARSTK
jgi:hypothetical protein